MFPEKIEERFYTHLQAIQILQQALGCSFLDAYIERWHWLFICLFD